MVPPLFPKTFINPQSKHADSIDVAFGNRKIIPWSRDGAGKRIPREPQRAARQRLPARTRAPEDPFAAVWRPQARALGPSDCDARPIASLQHSLLTYELFAQAITS